MLSLLMEKKKNLFLIKTLKIFLFIVLPLILIFIALNTKITGFSINSGTKIIAGGFLGIIGIFFIALLVLIILKEKTYKAS
jgi:hypothetical protein